MKTMQVSFIESCDEENGEYLQFFTEGIFTNHIRTRSHGVDEIQKEVERQFPSDGNFQILGVYSDAKDTEGIMLKSITPSQPLPFAELRAICLKFGKIQKNQIRFIRLK